MKIKGKVIQGKNRGRKLGYPTANIKGLKNIDHGIYISQTFYNGKKYKSATFIGNAITFDENEIFAETHLLDFNEDLYGKVIEISLIKKIRENQKFESVQNLVKQIEKDIEVVREYFKK